jgi:hypothetical protein
MVFRRRTTVAAGDPLHIAYRRVGRELFEARPMPEMLSPVLEPQFAATGNRPAFLRDEPLVIFPKG